MTPLVSILIPAHNAENWIADTVRSALSQTWNCLEIIVVDDGSTDNTLSIAKSFKSSVLKIVSQPNGGACSARNHALRLAQGELIQWLDSDDLLHPDKIACQMVEFQRAENNKLLFSSAFGTFYYRVSKAQLVNNSLCRDLCPIEWFVNRFFNDDSMFPAVWLVSRYLTEKVGSWNELLTMDDDGEYFSRIIASCDAVRFVPEAKSFYRQANSGSISKTINHAACQSLFYSYRKSIGYMMSLEDTERTRSCALKYLQTNLLYFYPDEPEILAEILDFARQLGGDLSLPEFSNKYNIVTKVLGIRSTKRVASIVRSLKQYTLKSADKLIFRFD